MASEAAVLSATQWKDGQGQFRQCRMDNEVLYDASVGVGGIADIELDAMAEYPERLARHKAELLIWHSVRKGLDAKEEFDFFLRERLTLRVYSKAKTAMIAAYAEATTSPADIPPPLVDGAARPV